MAWRGVASRGIAWLRVAWVAWRGWRDVAPQLTYCVELDLKGDLPNWVQNTIAPEQGLNCARIRDNLFKVGGTSHVAPVLSSALDA